MQSAEFLSAVFFYLKVGENLNQNWIVENLNNAFSTWNGKLGELWGLVTTGPQTFKGGAVWSVMQTLHNGMVGIGYALVVLFFAISLCKNTMNFHELKRPEAAIHYFLRFVAAKALVGYGMDIMLNVFSICNGIVTDMADSMGGISEAMVSLPAEMQTAIENVGFLASIPLWLVTILGSLFITVLSFVMILTVYGRFFRLYMYTALAPLPLAAFAGESTQSVGISFLKSYVGVCLEGAVIVLACVIYSAFVSTPTVASGEATTIVWSLEAAAQTEQGEILCSMQIRRQYLAIRCENTYSGTLRTDENGELLTTKDDASDHGFGLMKMRAIAKKYGSVLDISYDENRFTVMTALKLLPEKKNQ